MKKAEIYIRIIGEVADDFDLTQLEDCLYNNVMFDIDGFEIGDAKFLVKEVDTS